MIFDASNLAEKKHRQTGHAVSAWQKALESAQSTLKLLEVDFEALEHIAVASASPEKFTVIARLIYQSLKSHVNEEEIAGLIVDQANRSLFALSDWVDSIEYFHNWLVARDRKIDFLTMINYLECCANAPDAKEAGQTLLALAEDMLEVHGYEGKIDAKCR